VRSDFWADMYTRSVHSMCTVIWDALKAACESDIETAKVILESAGVIVSKSVSSKLTNIDLLLMEPGFAL